MGPPWGHGAMGPGAFTTLKPDVYFFARPRVQRCSVAVHSQAVMTDTCIIYMLNIESICIYICIYTDGINII